MNVASIVNAACRQLGFSPDASETADALEALNLMLQEWSTSPNGVFAVTRENFALTAGTASYTIGTGGVLNTARPNRIRSAFIRVDSVDTPLLVYVSDIDYAEISMKSLPGQPAALYFERTYPLGTLIFYPTPETAYDLHLHSLKPLGAYTSASDSLNLPPEFEPAIKFNLAVELSEEFGKPVSQTTAARAQQALAALKRLYAHPVPQVVTDPFGGGGSVVYSRVTDSMVGGLEFSSGNYLTF